MGRYRHRNFSFFIKRGGSGEIRGRQIAEYLGAKINPEDGYEDDVCIYVKSEPPVNYPKRSYLDILDEHRRIKWLKNNTKVGVIGGNGALQLDKNELKKKLKFIHETSFKTRQDVVSFYMKIDAQIIWRPQNRPLKNPLKIINAASFGIPTIAYPEIAYMEVDGMYVKASTVNELINQARSCSYDANDLQDMAEKYHIDSISRLYPSLRIRFKR